MGRDWFNNDIQIRRGFVSKSEDSRLTYSGVVQTHGDDGLLKAKVSGHRPRVRPKF